MDLNTYDTDIDAQFYVSLCVEGVDLNLQSSSLAACEVQVSLCVEGVDLNMLRFSPVLTGFGLPLRRGSGFKHPCRDIPPV